MSYVSTGGGYYYCSDGACGYAITPIVIVATNVDLKKLVREKKFREDLFFRLSEFTITLPPLRERVERHTLSGGQIPRKGLGRAE